MALPLDRQLDNLIEAGWQVIESDYDIRAFCQWRKEVVNCLIALLGPDDRRTRIFEQRPEGLVPDTGTPLGRTDSDGI
ncbi:MAG: hypothetical protein FJY85_20475 [Deltaproteobacteria bacterium]|nr:hypothetical protein [Deltaproteobacteria bacterium]